MPTFFDILIETQSEVANRIADLCNQRQELFASYEMKLSGCKTLEEALQLQVDTDERADLIDAEVEVRSRALKKLGAQLEALA